MKQRQGWQTGQPLSIWIKYAVILLLGIGIFFRFFNLDRKIYWLDETYTSLRLSGYTKTELVQTVATGAIVSAQSLQRYQQLNAERGLQATFEGLAAEEPQLLPLYFVLTRLWAQRFGDSVGAIRSLSAVISLFAFPCLGWLCLELFQSFSIAWLAVGLFAVSPLQVLYAQEARPYSLWTLTILLSSAVLLWAMRTKSRLSWSLYAITVCLGLYTHLLFGLVVIAHAVYVIVVEKRLGKKGLGDLTMPHLTMTQTSVAYGLAALAGSLPLVPWLIRSHFAQAQSMTAALREPISASFLLNQWWVNSSRVLVGWDLGLANLIPVLGILYALYFLCSTTPKQIWLLLLALVAVPFLALALPDLLLEGSRSTRIRYLIPSYLGIQIALAYLFASQAIWYKRWRAMLVFLISINIIACGISTQSQVWWSKSVPRSSYYPPVSAIINQIEAPLIISDSDPMEVLAFSRWLDPNVKLQLVTAPKTVRVAKGFDAVFLLNPSKRLRTILTNRDYPLKLVYNDRNAPEASENRLWRVGKRG